MREIVNELTNDRVVLKMMELLKVQGKTEKELIEYLGMTPGMFSKWKYNNTKSYRKHLDKIAEFFEVSQAYLLEDVDDIINVNTMTISELRLIQLYRKMETEKKEILLKTAEIFIGE